jgi:hypothetical protein
MPHSMRKTRVAQDGFRKYSLVETFASVVDDLEHPFEVERKKKSAMCSSVHSEQDCKIRHSVRQTRFGGVDSATLREGEQ